MLLLVKGGHLALEVRERRWSDYVNPDIIKNFVVGRDIKLGIFLVKVLVHFVSDECGGKVRKEHDFWAYFLDLLN